MKTFGKSDLNKLYKPASASSGEDNGQVTIIGGSKLFHGAPLLSLKVASRIVDMVFFASPEPSVGEVAQRIKSDLFSFIWVPWGEVAQYVEKSDAVLIGPGLMRYKKESQNSNIKTQNLDQEGKKTRRITEKLLKKFPNKKWVIDAGSLQVMDADWIPNQAVLTPNKKELEILFGKNKKLQSQAKKYNCTIVAKGPETIVFSPEEYIKIQGGNPGLTKGGTGDVLAGLTLALLAKNNPPLASCAASYVLKNAADELYKKVKTFYNADDLADNIPKTLHRLMISKVP